MRPFVCIVFLLFACSAVAQNRPSDDLAKARFLEGRAAYEAGDYARAYFVWQESYKLSQQPGLLYNLGLAAQKLGNAKIALEAFDAYLAWGHGDRAEEVRVRVATLRDLVPRDSPPVNVAVPARSVSPRQVAKSLQAQPRPSTWESAPIAREPPRSNRGWWIAAGVVLLVAAVAVGVAVPLAKRDPKPEDPKPNTGLTINSLLGKP